MTEREEALEEAAKVAETRHTRWRMPHPDDARPGEVCCDVSACEDIAKAIRALASSPPPKGGDEQARPKTASAPVSTEAKGTTNG